MEISSFSIHSPPTLVDSIYPGKAKRSISFSKSIHDSVVFCLFTTDDSTSTVLLGRVNVTIKSIITCGLLVSSAVHVCVLSPVRSLLG